MLYANLQVRGAKIGIDTGAPCINQFIDLSGQIIYLHSMAVYLLWLKL